MALFSFPEHVTIHVHEHPNPEVLRELKDIKELLIHIKSQNLKLMSNTDQALQDIAGHCRSESPFYENWRRNHYAFAENYRSSEQRPGRHSSGCFRRAGGSSRARQSG